jgi:hypothetical protein
MATADELGPFRGRVKPVANHDPRKRNPDDCQNCCHDNWRERDSAHVAARESAIGGDVGSANSSYFTAGRWSEAESDFNQHSSYGHYGQHPPRYARPTHSKNVIPQHPRSPGLRHQSQGSQI